MTGERLSVEAANPEVNDPLVTLATNSPQTAQKNAAVRKGFAEVGGKAFGVLDVPAVTGAFGAARAPQGVGAEATHADPLRGTVPSMPRSRYADRELAAAREALACNAVGRAAGHVWSAAAAAASLGDEEALAALLDLATKLEQQTTGGQHEEAEQLRVYLTECLDEARRGTRPPSAFERLFTRAKRVR